MAFQQNMTFNEVALPVKDPVCCMTVTPQAPYSLEYDGKPVYFCSAGCKGKFVAN